MPRFNYTVKSQPDRLLEGDIEAETEQEAINKLMKMGYAPLSVKSEVASLEEKKTSVFNFRRVSHKDIALFTRQLSNLIESGVNIIRGLNIISRQTGNKRLKAILEDITDKIKDGNSLSNSLSAYPDLFSSLYTAMVHSGEAGGSMAQAVKSLADFLEKEEEFKSSLVAALTYPFFIFIVGIATVFILLGFVIPKLATMFEDMGQALPLPTKIMMDISGFFHNYWWLMLATIFIVIFLIQRLRKIPHGKASLDKIKLKIPLFGIMIFKAELSRLMRTLSLLLASGMPITPSLEISMSIADNLVLKAEMQRFKEEIAAGASLSSSFKGSEFFPDLVTSMVTIGEETGSLEKSLIRIADEYEREVERTLKATARMIEPIIILAMGIIVGFIVLSMLLPIFQINLMLR